MKFRFKFTKEENDSILAHAEGIAKQLKKLGFDSLIDYVKTLDSDQELVPEVLRKAGCEISEDSEEWLNESVEHVDWDSEEDYLAYMKKISDKLESLYSTEKVKLSVEDYDDDLLQEKLEEGVDVLEFLIENRDNSSVRKVIKMILAENEK